jgi:small subunit ribosomal protein S20
MVGEKAYEVLCFGKAQEGALVQSALVANIKSQIKRNKQNEAARQRNKAVRSALKTSSKGVTAAEDDSAQELLQAAARELDKAASKGIIHKRAAARRKSRLAKRVAAAG